MEWMYKRLGEFSDLQAAAVYGDLSHSRKQRIDSFKKTDDKKRSLLGEYLIKRLLKEKYGIENAVIEAAENGRPFLRDIPLFISISHSYEIVACAISENAVGIDVELPKPINNRLIDRVCTFEEKEYVLGGDNSEIITRFYEIWTGKEAYFKAKGTGITDFKEVNVLKLERRVINVGEYLVHII